MTDSVLAGKLDVFAQAEIPTAIEMRGIAIEKYRFGLFTLLFYKEFLFNFICVLLSNCLSSLLLFV